MSSQLSEKFLNSAEFQTKLKNIIQEGDMSTLTAGDIRRMLETHFSLEKDALKEKPYKKIINGFIDDFMSGDTNMEQSKPKPTEYSKRKASADLEEENVIPSRRTTKKKAKIESDQEEEEEEEEEEKAEEEQTEGDDDDDIEEEDMSPTKPKSKKKSPVKTKPTVSQPRAVGSEKDEDTIKKLKQFISKCGVRKVWSKELADCKNAKAEIAKLKNMLEELGVHGRPTIEKCEAIKKERELKAELDSLDTSLIINQDNERPTRASRNRSVRKPTYTIDAATDSEEEEASDNEENDKEEEEDETKEEEESEEDEEADSESEDEFKGSSDEE
ncbi:hypothetical protein BD560DRAFT_414172 [Blakeslea trispora]|nr:hypothetical protein BD560DRAFT_414172 [Blakeslea trispora]